MNELSVLLIGFLLGIRHATEADHLVAVAALATRQHSFAQSMRQGVAWGIGHSVTLLLFGGLVLALGASIPPRVAMTLELLVGGMLILLGVDVLRRFVQQRIHIHVHTHGTRLRHLHAHSHIGAQPHGMAGHAHAHSAGPPWRALAVGMTHGMAGTAALIVLSLGAAQSWRTGLAFIVLFGLGSIAGMAVLSMVIAIPLHLTAVRFGRRFNVLTAVIGTCSCALGVWTICRIALAEPAAVG
jgi:sulfite exporter TauE/SafE